MPVQEYSHESGGAESGDDSELRDAIKKEDERRAEAARAAAALAAAPAMELAAPVTSDAAGKKAAGVGSDKPLQPRLLSVLTDLDSILQRWGPAHTDAAVQAASSPQVRSSGLATMLLSDHATRSCRSLGSGRTTVLVSRLRCEVYALWGWISLSARVCASYVELC